MSSAEHLDVSARAANRKIIDALAQILERGQAAGVFRRDIDPMQLHLTISGFGFHFVSNQHRPGMTMSESAADALRPGP